MGQRAPSHLHPGSAGLQRTVAGISSVSPDEDQDRPFARLHYAVPTAPGPTGTRAEHVHGHARRASTDSCQLLARFLPPRDGLHARGFAGSARRTANRDPSRWVSSCDRPTPSGSSTSTRSSSAQRACACTSGSSACPAPARAFATGGGTHWASGGPRHARAACRGPTWILSTCLATLSGHASARPCARTSRKLQPGPSGNTKPTPSPPSPTGATFATNRETEQGDVLGTIQSALVLGQARDAHVGEFLSNPSRTTASATNGLSMMGRCSSVLFSLIPSSMLWTLPLPPVGPPGGALRRATSRAPRTCFVLLSADPSFHGWGRDQAVCRRVQAHVSHARQLGPP